MKVGLWSKLLIALSSIFIVPILIIVGASIAMRYNVIKVPALQNLDVSTIQIIAEGKSPEDIRLALFAFLGILVFSISGMVLIISKIIADFVLLPLRELNRATERVGSGDLDFTISYKEDNEFGKLCTDFDMMRDKLLISTRKQNIYENSRKELIASITHDLKTPLTSIIGYVEGLQDGVVTNPETINNYLNVIHDKSIRLDHLIDDLFTFTQLEHEKFTVKTCNLSMKNVLTEYTNTKKREFKSKEIKLIVTEPIHDAVLAIDEFRFGQVLENLINNATKFTKSFIKVYTEVSDNFYYIYVEDDGIGIASKDLPHIFDYFYQCDKARETKKQGSGLGLAICKQLIESHQGKIYVSSKVGEGTIFKIRLRRS